LWCTDPAEHTWSVPSNAQPLAIAMIETSKCTNRPDCACAFCVQARSEIAGGMTAKDEENKAIEDFLSEYRLKKSD